MDTGKLKRKEVTQTAAKHIHTAVNSHWTSTAHLHCREHSHTAGSLHTQIAVSYELSSPLIQSPSGGYGGINPSDGLPHPPRCPSHPVSLPGYHPIIHSRPFGPPLRRSPGIGTDCDYQVQSSVEIDPGTSLETPGKSGNPPRCRQNCPRVSAVD